LKIIMSEKTHYQVLDINQTATYEEIKEAYRLLAMVWHPDRVQEKNRERASEKMKEVNNAYEILSNTKRRAAYDRSLNQNGTKANQSASTTPPPPRKPPVSSAATAEGLSEARARAHANITLWQQAVAITKQAAGVAECQIPLADRLINGADEAAQQVNNTDWLMTIGIDKEAVSARAEILTTAKRLVEQERQLRVTAESKAHQNLNQAQHAIEQAKRQCEIRISNAKSQQTSEVSKAEYSKPKLDTPDMKQAFLHGLGLTAGAWTIGAFIFLCLDEWLKHNKSLVGTLLYYILGAIVIPSCYLGWAIVPLFHTAI
jgi:hypothetical protein